MSVQTLPATVPTTAADAVCKAGQSGFGSGAATTATATGIGAAAARRTTSSHAGGDAGAGDVLRMPPSGAPAGGGGGSGANGRRAGMKAPAGAGAAGAVAAGLEPLRRVPTPLQVPTGPPLPRRRKVGRLRRAWLRFKHMATCSSVATLDPPLHGVALTPGETAEDVSREIAEEEAEAAAQAAAGGLAPSGPLPPPPPATAAAAGFTPHTITAADGTLPPPRRQTPSGPRGASDGSDHLDKTCGSNITHINESSHGGPTLIGGGGGGRAARHLTPMGGGGGSSGAAADGRLPQHMGFVRGRESVSSVKSAGSAEEDWHDARSVASNFSVMSCFSASDPEHAQQQHQQQQHQHHQHQQPQHPGVLAHHLSQGGGGHAPQQPHHPPYPPYRHQHSDGALQPSQYGAAAAATAKAAAEALSHQLREARQADVTTMPEAQQAQAQAPVLPGTPPAIRRQTPPAGWSPETAATTTVAAELELEAGAGAAAASPLPAATPREAAEAVEAEAETLAVRGLAVGDVPEVERPSWVPEKPIPGMDPAIRYVPVPKVTGIAAYWAKVPELSAPIPMPIDVALGCNRLARTAHESIRGILFRETDTEIIMKARLTLPLGVKMTHEERYHKDNTPHTVMIRRDVKPGKTVTRMYYTEDGDTLLLADAYDMSGRITHTGYELVHIVNNGERIECRQWVLIAASGRIVEQYFVGQRAPLPGHH